MIDDVAVLSLLEAETTDAADVSEPEPSHALADPREVSRLTAQFISRAWLRFGIRRATAEDLVQSAFVAYWQVKARYPSRSEHAAILAGIFRHMCLRHIRRAEEERRRLQRYCSNPDAVRENPWMRAEPRSDARDVLATLAARDARREIVDALERLSPSSKRIAELIATEGMRRQELIEHFGVNKNTLDSRLRACRIELKRLLEGKPSVRSRFSAAG